MSRYYTAELTLAFGTKPDERALDKIQGAAHEIWPFEDHWDEFYSGNGDGHCYRAYGDGCLVGGESEEEFARRLCHHIWRVAKCYVGVTVRLTYLEELPYIEVQFDRKDYDNFQQLMERHGILDAAGEEPEAEQ